MTKDEKDETGRTQTIVEVARERFNIAKEAYSKQRQLAVEDTKFVMGDSDNNWQWPNKVFSKRAEQDEKVCLTVNLTAQHCNQIVNDIRQQRPQVKVSPVDNHADKKTASILGGLIMNLQSAATTQDAHIIGAEHAVYGGEGYWRWVTEYESETSFGQVLRAIACPNPQLVYIDPNAKESDRSDANWGFVFEDVPIEQCKREHPEIGDPTSWGDDVKAQEWYSDETIRRAEYFYCERKKDKAFLLSDGTTALKSEIDAGNALAPGVTVIQERDTEIKSWKWCKLVGGYDKPVDERDWLGKYLPIITVVGKELNVDGKVIRKGQVRDLKDTARMVNYAFSETVQTLALQNKVPYMAAAQAIEGYEDEWKNANKSNEAVLPWNARDEDGNELPKPERQLPAIMPTAQVQLLQLSTEQMRGASGQQASNFGIRSEAQSGIGIQRLKVQGEIATFHFPDNYKRALRYEAKVLIDLIQKYYDTRRVVRILGLDGTESEATLDPEAQAYMEQQVGEQVQRVFNPSVGQYDVVTDVGPSFQTQRQESAMALADMANHAKDPGSSAVLQYLAVKSADFAGSEEAAELLGKLLPPGMLEQEGAAKIPPQVAQQMQQMGQQMQEMQQAMQEMQQELQKAQAGTEAKIATAQIDARVKQQQSEMDAAVSRENSERDAALAIEKARIDAATKIRVAMIDRDVKRELTTLEGQFGLAETEIESMTKERIADRQAEATVEAAEHAAEAQKEIAEKTARQRPDDSGSSEK